VREAFSGVSLWGLFQNDEIAPGRFTGNLLAHGLTQADAYNSAFTSPLDKDLNLFCFGCSSDTQNFITSAPAFTGVGTLDLTGYSILAAGSYGDIHDDDFSPGTIIGQWKIIDSSAQIPTPATLALFGLGLAGLGWSRRKKE
jgi:hypothetical protein